jgi:hypothetical protein
MDKTPSKSSLTVDDLKRGDLIKVRTYGGLDVSDKPLIINIHAFSNIAST